MMKKQEEEVFRNPCLDRILSSSFNMICLSSFPFFLFARSLFLWLLSLSLAEKIPGVGDDAHGWALDPQHATRIFRCAPRRQHRLANVPAKRWCYGARSPMVG